jgi:hypothetical protein
MHHRSYTVYFADNTAELLQILKKGINVMGKRKRRGKLNWRSKKANHGRKPTLG